MKKVTFLAGVIISSIALGGLTSSYAEETAPASTNNTDPQMQQQRQEMKSDRNQMHNDMKQKHEQRRNDMKQKHKEMKQKREQKRNGIQQQRPQTPTVPTPAAQ